VADALKSQKLAQRQAHKTFKHHTPQRTPGNQIWAMDSTVTDAKTPTEHTIIGLIDHGTRVLTGLQKVTRFNTWTALGVLCLAVGQWGKPKRVRTDNATVFHSRTWRFGLKFLGIKCQFTQPGSPWQNGTIERLFNTFKERWQELAPSLKPDIHQRLAEFTHWYNATRPHQNLQGQTPLEAWHAQAPPQRWQVQHWWGGALRAVVMRQ
jgi:putative transposase